MFYKYIVKKWEVGLVSIGLPAFNGIASSDLNASDVTLSSTGVTGMVLSCLSKDEKLKLAELAKRDAKSLILIDGMGDDDAPIGLVREK